MQRRWAFRAMQLKLCHTHSFYAVEFTSIFHKETTRWNDGFLSIFTFLEGEYNFLNSEERLSGVSESYQFFHSQTQHVIRTIYTMLILSELCTATLDLSNLNLNDFQFFRYEQSLPYGEVKQVQPPPPSIGSHLQRAKAGK